MVGSAAVALPGTGADAGAVAADDLEDEALARQVILGDAPAEEMLCRRLLPRVRAWGLKHLREEAAARDLAQHVVLAVLEALRTGRVAQLDRLGPFVLGVCKNTMLEWNRNERRRSTLLERFGPAFADADGVRIDDVRLDRRRLAGCFERLAARPRTVLALTYYAEQSTEAIATELGLSPENVRVLRYRALKQLQHCMTEEP